MRPKEQYTVHIMLPDPGSGRKMVEFRIPGRGTYVWNPVWKTYNHIETNEVLTWGQILGSWGVNATAVKVK